MEKVKLIVKSVYGRDLIYPINYRSQLHILTKKKTLDMSDINALKEIGVEFEQVNTRIDVENKV